MVIAEKLPTHRCEPCNDTGWLRWTDKEGAKLSNRCSYCRDARPDQASVQRLMIEAGCMQSEVDAAFRPWDRESRVAEPVRFLDWCRAVARGEHPDVWCWTLTGSRGVGKSMSAGMGLRAYLEEGGRNARWVPVGETLEDIAVERSEVFVSQLERSVLGASIAFLEDAGDEGENRAGEVDRWIAHFYRRLTPLVITTNAETEKALKALFNARSVSRLHEGQIVWLQGDDYRRIRATRED